MASAARGTFAFFPDRQLETPIDSRSRHGITRRLLLGLVLLTGLSGPLAADPVPEPQTTPYPLASEADPAPGNGDRSRDLEHSVPVGEGDLAALEERILAAIDQVLPATVALRVPGASGSGVIVDEDGLILTAGHVSGNPGRRVRVTLADGREVTGRTLGWSQDEDCGMVQLDDAGPWPHVEVLDDRPATGLWCLALGHPGGLQDGRPPVVRVGRVISSGRSAVRSDCNLVGGDSGGPLIDLDGKLIGIHSRIGEDLSANYHVPMGTFRDAWERLLAGKSWGRHTRGVLGVYTVTSEEGCRITDLVTDFPASQAGLRSGDLIRRVDDRAVRSREDLIDALDDRMAGDEVTIQVTRGEEQLQFTIALARAP